MENAEAILRDLEEFERSDTHDIPRVLEEYLQHIAKTGDVVFPWIKAKHLIRRKLEIAIAEFHKFCPTESLKPPPNVEPFNFDTQKTKILDLFEMFTGAPFTIQRLCELLIAPQRHYKRTDKFMRGIEKNLLVVSTVEPGQVKKTDSVSPTQTFLNGVLDSDDVPVESSTWNADSVTTAHPNLKEEDRREPEPVDNMSISDADSGISDTEDEENPSKKDAKKEVEMREDVQGSEIKDTKNSDEEEQATQIGDSIDEKDQSEQPDKVSSDEADAKQSNEIEEKQSEEAAEKDNQEALEERGDSENHLAANSAEIESKDQADESIEMKDADTVITREEVDMELGPTENSNLLDGISKPVEKKRILSDLETVADECHAAKQQRISSPTEDVTNPPEGSKAGPDTPALEEKAEETAGKEEHV